MSDEMPEKGVCPSCGSAVPEGAPEGLCPACVMKAAAVAETEERNSTSPTRLLVPPVEKIAEAFPELEVLEFIGCGGMAAVYKARQRKLDRVVALKVLPRSFGEKVGFGERFEREGRVLAKLSHPNIVGIFDYGESDGFYFLIMEYVEGVNLRQAMRAGRFTPAQALGVVPDICEALQFAHEKGVLHRDIKPENILLDAEGRVKIADFGIAKIVGEAAEMEATLTGTGSLGTPQYMAPEQVETPRQVDHRADIYSLGVVFYEMLTGELPMGRFAEPSKKSDVGAQVDEIVMRALAKDRELRQQSAEDLRTEVEGVSGSPMKGGKAAGETSAVNPWPKRVFWGLAAIVLCPVLLLLLVFGMRFVSGPGGGTIGAPEALIILLIGGFWLAVLVAVILGVAHLAGWRRHAPARVAARPEGAPANPWPRRTFWLVAAVVFVPFVIVPVALMVPWAAREQAVDTAELSRRKAAANEEMVRKEGRPQPTLRIFRHKESEVAVFGDGRQTVVALVYEKAGNLSETSSSLSATGECHNKGRIVFKDAHTFAYEHRPETGHLLTIDEVKYDLVDGGQVFDLAADGSVRQRKMWPNAIGEVTTESFFEALEKVREGGRSIKR